MKPILIYIKNKATLNGLLLVLLQLERRGYTQVFLATDDRSVEPYANSFRNDLSARFMSLETAAQYHWAAIVSTHLPPESACLQGPLMIMPHGTGFGVGGMYSTELARYCDVFFGHAPNELEYLKRHLGEEFPIERFTATGCPSSDELAQCVHIDDAGRVELKLELGLDPDRPVMLVTSHWTPDSILRTWGQSVLSALEPFSEQYSIVQIAHRGIWDFPMYDTFDPGRNVYQQASRFDSKGLFVELNTYCAGRKHFYFLPYANTQKLLAVADLLIGDYSSIIIEYCVLDRPVVFSNRPERFFSKTNYQNYAAACGAADSINQLADAVRGELDCPMQRSEARQRLAGSFLWNLGNAASAVADGILERLQ